MMKQLAGELDDIIMHALEKPPDRRYGSAGAFGEDVRRFLRGDTVTARRPTNRHIYRFKKYFQRNRAGVIGVAVMILIVISSLTLVVLGHMNGLENDRIAAQALAYEESLKLAAESEARRAAQYSEILWDELIQSSDFNLRMTVDQRQAFYSSVLDRFTEVEADSPSGDQALIRKAEILTQLANSLYSVRGSSSLEIDQASELLMEAVETIKRVQSETNFDAAAPLVNALRPLADVYEANGNTQRAMALRSEIITILNQILESEDLAPNRNLAINRNINAMNRKIAEFKAQQCDLDGALSGFQDCLAITSDLRNKFPDSESVLRDWSVARANYAQLLTDLERPDEARPLSDQVLQVRQLLLEKSPYEARQLRDLATAHYQAALVDIKLEYLSSASTHLESAIELIERGLVEERFEDERLLENWIQFNFEYAKLLNKIDKHDQARILAETITDRSALLRDGSPSIGDAIPHRLMPIRIKLILDISSGDHDSVPELLQLQSKLLAELPEPLMTAKLRLEMATEVVLEINTSESAFKDSFIHQGRTAIDELDQAGLGCQVPRSVRGIFE
jgi:tetratricopeptide (TPR) repeat protein